MADDRYTVRRAEDSVLFLTNKIPYVNRRLRINNIYNTCFLFELNINAFELIFKVNLIVLERIKIV